MKSERVTGSLTQPLSLHTQIQILERGQGETEKTSGVCDCCSWEHIILRQNMESKQSGVIQSLIMMVLCVHIRLYSAHVEFAQ